MERAYCAWYIYFGDCLYRNQIHWKYRKLSELMQVYSLIGFVLSLLLVFRTNTAYDRRWEGRKKWGELVNNSRNLAIKISALTDDPEIRTYFKRTISNYVFAMKNTFEKA